MERASFTIFHKGLLLVGVPILFQLLFIGLFMRVQADAADAEHWALHTKDVIAQAEQSYRIVSRAFTQARSSVLLGEGAPPSAAEADRMLAEVDQLRALVADNPSQAAAATAYRADAAILAAWARDVARLVEADRRDQAADLIHARPPTEALARMQSWLDRFVHTEEELDAKRTATVAATRRMQRWLLIAAAVVSTILAALAAWLFSSNIASRVAALAANARALGDRRPLGAPIAGSDEIAAVDGAFREAAGRLADAEAAERKAREEVEARAAELDRVNRDLSLKTQENETFVYSVSHDLRSPLVNLQGFSRELAHTCEDLRQASEAPGVPPAVRQQLLSLIDGDIRESVAFIQSAVSRSGNIIDALLRLSRAGRVEYNWVAVPVRRVVDRVVTAMSDTIRHKAATIVVANDLPDAWGDATAVEQIFGNLIGNAVNYLDAARPGRVEVGTVPELVAAAHVDHPVGEAGTETVAAADATRGPKVTYFVRDNGLGIPAAYLPKIFVAFQRLHGQVAPGEGIGLALVRRVIERHGGTIRVESIEGQGTTFFVTLPAPQPAEPPTDPTVESATTTAMTSPAVAAV